VKLSIAKKFGLILFLPLLGAAGLLWEFSDFQSKVEAGVPFTNVAGRQRMLSEQLHSYAYMVHIGQQEDRKALKELIAEFTDSLDVLQHGGHLYALNVDLQPAPAEVIPALTKVHRIWSPLKEDLLHIADLPETDPQSWLAWSAVNAGLPSLTAAAHEVVEAFEAYDMALHRRIETLLEISMVFALFLFIGGFWGTKRYIVRPLLQLTDMAAAMDAGNYTHRVVVNTHDELAILGDTFNSMAKNIADAICLERNMRHRLEILTKAVITICNQPVKEKVIKHVGEIAKDVTNAHYAMITYTVDGERHFYTLGLAPEQEQALVEQSFPPVDLLGPLWEEKQTVRIDDITAHSAGHPDFLPGNLSIKSFLGTPILFGQEIFGAIYLADKEGGQPFTGEDESIIDMLASACAVAVSNTKRLKELKIVNARLEQRVAERTRELEKANRRLRNREVELELMNDELTSANEAKNQFLANTSHELRTPLNAIIGFSELLKNPKTGTLSKKQQRYVNHVHASGKRLLNIINDLLDISKIEAGMMTIDETACRPYELAREVVDELKPLAEGKDIRLTLESDCPRDEQAVLDSGKLRQILLNLVGNAIKFTSGGGKVDVHIGMSGVGADKRMLKVTVTDTGCGISPADQERIFEPFVQVSGGLGRQHTGTGLGLALTRRQVSLLGGSIHLSSEPGHGSQFTVELPIAVPYIPAEVADKSGKEQEEVGLVATVGIAEVVPAKGPRPKILVVDEIEERAKAVVSLMEQQGYEASTADISTAGEKCEAMCAYLIMLGIPAEEDGLHHCLQELKTDAATRDLPVILVGGSADELEFSMVPVGVVEKGIQQQELLDMIARYCRYVPTHPKLPTVLVIDDELSVREFLKEMLVMEGFRVLLADSGLAGVQIAMEREPDIIILDLMMPKVSGFDVIRQLSHHPDTANIPIVIYTAKDLSHEESLQLGRQAESILIKGANGRTDLLRQLQKMELLYPVRAHLIDPVLDCFNARYMERRLEEEVSIAKRHASSFSLISWQIDNYDDYIRQHGERWGIAAMKEMLEMVQMVTRRGDICAHMAEARFMLFLPSISPVGAIRVSEKLRLRIRHQRFLLPEGQTGAFRASFAAVYFGDDAEDVQGLMRMLEERLEEAIHAGGDRGCYGGGYDGQGIDRR